jgi:hypothetical protein
MSWVKRFENPAVIAASVASLTTLSIALVTAGSAIWTAHIQSQADIDKSIRETKRQLLVSAFAEGSIAEKLNAFIEGGILSDSDCKLRKTLLHYSDDCKPPPPH